MDWQDQIIKMAILPKAIYKFNAIPIKIPTLFFIGLEREIIKFIWNNKKKNKIAKTIINKKRTSVGISVPDFRQCYRAIMIKTAWHLLQVGTSMELN